MGVDGLLRVSVQIFGCFHVRRTQPGESEFCMRLSVYWLILILSPVLGSRKLRAGHASTICAKL